MKELLGCAAGTSPKLVWKNSLTVPWHPGVQGEGSELVCMQFPRWVMHENVPSVPMGVGRFPSLVMRDLLQIWNAPRVRFRVVLQPGSSFNIASLRVSHAYVPLKLFSAMTPITSLRAGAMAQDTLGRGGGHCPGSLITICLSWCAVSRPGTYSVVIASTVTAQLCRVGGSPLSHWPQGFF